MQLTTRYISYNLEQLHTKFSLYLHGMMPEYITQMYSACEKSKNYEYLEVTKFREGNVSFSHNIRTTGLSGVNIQHYCC
jgi:hypothetical protein